MTLLGTLFFTAQRDLTFVRAPGETFSNAFSLAVPAVAVYLLVLFGLGFAGVLRRWWTAALAGLLAAFVGSTLGYALQVISNGLELSGETWGMIFGEFVGLNVQFSVAGVLAAALLCPPVYRRLTGEAEPGAAVRYVEGPSSIDDSGSAFVRIPSTAMLEDMDEATRETANTQWEAMVAAFEEAEWGTQAVPEAEDERLAVFVGDTALVLGEQVIPARPKQDARRGEFGDVRETLAEAGAVFDELEAPAVFDPADVVEGIGVLYVGVGGATNASAVRGLRSAVRDRGYEVVAVPVAEGVRLSDAASVLPDGTKLVWEPGIRNPEVFGGRVATAEPSGAAVVALDEQTIAVPASAPKTRALLGELGYVTVELDISVFEEAGGSLPRLSLRSRD
ncbi:NG,NG-dimethylarginine dimethylaminohydrolase 1 [Gulosibacter sp. 10]|nr:NG,NG-dimethylarginine dimethylaminohydrolase 1 [Gulosibacter sp. 10]